MKIILIGYMGSGKTSVGKVLAANLDLPFKDLDEVIEKVEGMSIAEIFSKKGEIYFRRLENEVLKKLVSRNEEFVLATGGGTPCYADSMSIMQNTSDVLTVYLKTPLQILCERLLTENERRPLLAHLNSREQMQEFVGIHVFERSHFYNKAGLIIETAKNSVEDIAKKIEEQLF